MAYDYSSSIEQSATLERLLASHPVLLSREELRREIGEPDAVDQALDYFERMGLVHRVDGPTGQYFWPTRTAMATEEAATAPMHPDRSLK
jgi:hypothetical protein